MGNNIALEQTYFSLWRAVQSAVMLTDDRSSVLASQTRLDYRLG